MTNNTFRLVTRSDFDGLVCATLLKHLKLIEEVSFVHPKDMQDGTVTIGGNDITTNLPYVPGVHLAFDHHASEVLRNRKHSNHIIDENAPSAARVVWRHYDGESVFPASWDELMTAVDKCDSADFTIDEVLNPTGWILINFLMDPRTGLGRFHDFRISNYQLMMDLITYCVDHNLEETLAMPDVKERIDLYLEHDEKFKEQIKRCAQQHGNVVVLDLREEETIYAGNRFIIYALFPEANISITALWGKAKQNTVFATGKSIFDRSSTTHVGDLMLQYGGGGHDAAGTCQVDNDEADTVLPELIERLKQ